MEYTANYHLPQWVESDRIMMGDFNEAMDGIDQGIASAQDTAEAAQSAAEAAQSSADAVQNAYTPDNKPYVTGTYTGDSDVQEIYLGFFPSAVIIGQQYSSNAPEDTYGSCSIFSGNGRIGILTFDEEGFTLFPNSSSCYPSVNWKNIPYWYIALR